MISDLAEESKYLQCENADLREANRGLKAVSIGPRPPTSQMIVFIDEYRDHLVVEFIFRIPRATAFALLASWVSDRKDKSRIEPAILRRTAGTGDSVYARRTLWRVRDREDAFSPESRGLGERPRSDCEVDAARKREQD